MKTAYEERNDMEQKTPLYIGVLAVVIILGAVTFAAISTPSMSRKDLKKVKEVCDYSRSVKSMHWEEACRSAQDAANAEYLCDGIEAGSHCWVEAK